MRAVTLRAASIDPGDRVRLDFPASELHGCEGTANLVWPDRVGATWSTPRGRFFVSFRLRHVRRVRWRFIFRLRHVRRVRRS